MKSPIFLDTGYVLALANARDKYHEPAQVARKMVSPPYLTTEAVLVEVGNALSRLQWRSLSVALLEQMRNHWDCEVVPVDTPLLDRAIDLYASRMDKEWGLTDCISFVVMHERGLMHVLATDRHFEQAGFVNILLHPPLSTRS